MATALKVPTIFTAIDKFSSVVSGMTKNVSAFGAKAERIGTKGAQFFNKVGAGADNAFNKIVNLKNAAVVAFAAMAAKKGYDLVVDVGNRGDDIDKNSRLVNLNAEAYQKLHFAAMRENVASEVLDKSLIKLNKNVGELQMNQGSLYSNLKKTNPALLAQLKHVKSNEEAFYILSGEIAKAPNQLQKTALATKYFGKSGTEMLKLLEIGPDGIAKLSAEAERLGIVMGGDAIANAAKFADINDNFNTTLTGLKTTIGVALIPTISNLLQKFTEWVGNNRELIKVKVAEFAEKISDAIKYLTENSDKIIPKIKLFAGALIALKLATISSEIAVMALKVTTGIITGVMWLYTVAQVAVGTATSTSTAMTYAAEFAYGLYVVGVVLATAATSAFTAVLGFLISPITLVFLAIGALVALVVVIIKHWNSWGAALSIFLGPLGLVISLIQSFRIKWEMIKQAFKTDGIVGGLKAIGATILDAILMPLQQVFHLLAKLPKSLGGGMFASAEAKLLDFRTNLGVNTTTDESGNTAVKPAVNSKAAAQQGMVNAVQTNNQNKNVTIDFKNMPKGVETSGNGLSFLTPKTTSTLGF